MDNVMQLAGSGISGVAVISAVFAQKDIKEAAAALRERGHTGDPCRFVLSAIAGLVHVNWR